MDTKKNLDTTEQYLEQLKDLFKELSSAEVYEKWVDTFGVEVMDDKHVLITYHGPYKLKDFKKECSGVLGFCIYSLLGEKKKIKITGKRRRNTLSPKMKKNIKAVRFFFVGMVFLCLAAFIVVVLCSYIGNRSFKETFYNTSSIKVDSTVRVVQLSDLHGTSYGKNNTTLINRVTELEPDIIICTGDIVDTVERDADYAVSLSKELAKIAPTYYVYGNHEIDDIYGFSFNEEVLDKKFGFNQSNRDETALLKLEDPFEENLEATGVKVLKNEKDTIQVKTMMVDVYGVLNSNPSSFWSYSEKAFLSYLNENEDHLKITAVHQPFIFEEFQPEFWGDLMVAGHTHGGLIQVPILGPLVTPEGGLFPERGGKFVYGRYDAAGTPLIISAGLENSNVLRINNPPELVVIDINKF